jgi:N-acetylglucosamine-6-phosphate deacetylase
MSGHHRLLAEHVVTPRGVMENAVLEISGSRLVSSEAFTASTEGEPERIRGWVVPGFIDIHVHGGGGFDYATEDPEVAISGRAFHASHGTTTSLASLVTAPIDLLCRQIMMLAGLVNDGHFAGIHLEGPFLSAAQCGAHDPSQLRSPDPASVERIITAGRGALSMITIAPELPGAISAIRQFIDAGVHVAIGHTDADHHTVATALDAGASVATHVFNAMRRMHHREPGPIPLLLTDRRVGVELIVDGLHLHSEIVRMVAAAAGQQRTILITDAMTAAGMADGEFRIGGLPVRVRDGTARLIDADGRPGSLAGSTLTMSGAFHRMTSIIGEIHTVALMTSTNAARHLGLREVGRVEAGCQADLCVVDDQGVLQRVMQAGRWLTESPPA